MTPHEKAHVLKRAIYLSVKDADPLELLREWVPKLHAPAAILRRNRRSETLWIAGTPYRKRSWTVSSAMP